ncbi:MAG: hypothetical protein ACI4MN_01735 [Candidatus Coproplasma sp.]
MNVKKLLKKQKSAVMPSESVKRRIAADCGVQEEISAPVGGGAAVKVKRNVAVSVGACCCAAVAAITCAIIFLKPAGTTTLPDVIETEFGTMASATDFYAYSAVSIGNMLDSTDLESVASAFALAENFDASFDVSVEITDLQKKILDKYAVFATGMLGGGKITSTCTAADRADYEFKLGIGYSDGFGSSADTVLYFNKVADSIKIDGDEEEYAIDGILVKGSVAFPVEGWYEAETDGAETEHGIEFIAYTSLDKKSFIKMKYEHSSDIDETESELVIKVHENGKETEKAIIKGETGEDSSFEVKIERPTEQEDVKEEINIKFNPFDEEGEKVMHIDAEFGGYMYELVMQNKPWEQGGGFDYIHRYDGVSDDELQGEPDDEDKEDKEDVKDKENEEDKEEFNPYPDFPGYEWSDEDYYPFNLI